MYRNRAISNALILAMVITSLGTDYLATAGGAVRAEAMVGVAEKMAARFTRAFPRRAQQPTVVLAARPQTSVVEPLPAGQQPSLYGSMVILQQLYLPPPARA